MIITNVPAQFQVGQSIQLGVEPQQEVTWFSSDTRTALITPQGVVTPLLVGEVVITATAEDGTSAFVLVEVINEVRPTTVRIEPQRLNLQIGQTFPLELFVTPSNANPLLVTWGTSDPTIVSLDGTIVTGVGLGTSLITVTASNGSTSTCRIEVLRQEVTDEPPFDVDARVPVDKSWLDTDRVYSQYRTHPKYVKWFNITRVIGKPIAEAIRIIREMYNIDKMEGAQLDIIGRIVGVSRKFTYEAVVNQAWYAPDGLGAEYGAFSDAMYASAIVNAESNMSDELYRLVLKARIVRNNNGATYEDILRGMHTLFPSLTNVYIVDNEDMSYSIHLQGLLTMLQVWALLNVDLLPKPAGVKFGGFNIIPFDYLQLGDESKPLGDTNAQLTKVNIYGN